MSKILTYVFIDVDNDTIANIEGRFLIFNTEETAWSYILSNYQDTERSIKSLYEEKYGKLKLVRRFINV